MVSKLVKNSTIAAEITSIQDASEHGVLAYGDETIHYDIVRKSIKQITPAIGEGKSPIPRKVTIKVHPDQRVVATVPFDANSELIQSAMVKRARWIWQHIQDFKSQHDYVLPKTYVSGEQQFYLGRRYVLKVIVGTETTSNVKLFRGKLVVSLRKEKADRSSQVKALLDKWYMHRASIIFKERLKVMHPKATWVNDIPSYKIMAMQKQWGSCSVKGTLMLNPHLIKASKECIDYVILHELCHISEHNHSEKFWRLLTQVMPNWKEVKSKLDEMAELYLNE